MLRGQKRTPADFVKIVSELHPELDFSITEYKNARSPVKFRCKEHGEQEIQANGLLHGRGCPLCGRSRSGQANAERIAEVGRQRMAALSPEEKAAQAACARAGLTKESFAKRGETQKKRLQQLPEDEKQALFAKAKVGARKYWASVPPEERKARMDAVRAAKKQP